MKNLLKVTGIIAIVVIIGLSFAACGEDDCTHAWEWVVTKAATDFGDGEKTETCSKCKETKGKETVLANGMVQIPAGTFTMGPDELGNKATYSATLSAFKIGKYEVTQEQYQAVMGINPSSFSSTPAVGEIQGKRPVENVTWFDAVEFCNKLSAKEGITPVYTITGRTPATGYPITAATVAANWSANGYRLPTDAQWEYACKAGTTSDYYFGNDNTKLGEYAWFATNSDSKTHEVGKKKPNAFGLYDMHGNVFEWCWDWYDDYPTIAKTDYSGAVSGTYRVGRGGSWINPAGNLVSVRRYGDNPNYGDDSLGFRVARP